MNQLNNKRWRCSSRTFDALVLQSPLFFDLGISNTLKTAFKKLDKSVKASDAPDASLFPWSSLPPLPGQAAATPPS
jgi:hypothetical protein